MICVKVNDTLYPAVVEGKMQDTTWDGRETKQITSAMDLAIAFLFSNQSSSPKFFKRRS